jgi:hypothetical protein
MSAPAKQIEPDWADEKAAEIIHTILQIVTTAPRPRPRTPVAIVYLAAELRLIREEGVSEGIDRLGTQLGVGIFT